MSMTKCSIAREFLLLGIGLSLLISGCGEPAETGVDRKAERDRVKQVNVRRVDSAGPQGSVEYVGTLSANLKARVFSELGGTIERLLFEKGDSVSKGDLLAEVGTRSFRLNVQQAEATLEAAKSQMEKLKKGSRPQEIQIARAALEEAEAAFFEAEKDFKRIKGLYDIRAVSNREYDGAVGKLDTAKARMDSASQQLVLALKGPRVEDIKNARANLDQAMAQLGLAKEQLRKSRLHAPCNGIIAFRDLEEGEVVPPGAVITQVVDLSRLKIRVSLGERDLRVLERNKSFPFSIDAIPGKEFLGRFIFLSPTADPVTRSFPVELLIEETDPRMADGMTVRIRFPIADEKRTTKVPSAWLSEEAGKIGLYIVNDGKALFREVVLGNYYDQRVEILSGLSDKELVITNPSGLKTGDPVRYSQ
ncbi:MAG: efflux RND transporter periplasmic adaptor subunit [Pseudomonadota bacterium]